MSQQVINGYTITHQRGVIILGKDKSFIRFTPGEVDLLRNIINIALNMQSLPALPPSINNNRFSVNFTEDDTLSVEGIDSREGSIAFEWTQGDDLIKVIDQAYAIAINELKLGVAGVSTRGFIDPTPNI